jgi:hypothetical protein
METRHLPRTDPDLSAEAVVLEDGAPTYARARLTGWFERQEFHPVLSAFLLFIVSFLLFQGIATVVAIVMILGSEGVPDPDSILDVLEEATVPLLTGNTVGQFLGMALPVLLWTRLHTRDTGSFLRFRGVDPALVLLASIGLFGLLPCIQWLGQINETIPLPQFLVELERSQMELIERILGGEVSIGAMVFALAVTPAICEEILFRGYLQRQFERSFGVAGGILVSGVLFGLYHFRLSQAVPLIILGVYLGYLVWRTGSIWIVVVVHFLNNGFAIVANNYVAANPDLGVEDIDAMSVPWSLVVSGAVVLALVIWFMNKRVQVLAGQEHDVEASYG